MWFGGILVPAISQKAFLNQLGLCDDLKYTPGDLAFLLMGF